MIDSSPCPPHRRASAGFSLVEALIAAALLLLVAVGVLPMFAQAIRANTTGQTTTMATNAVRSSFEDYLARDFHDPALELATDATARTNVDYWVSSTDHSRRPFWIAGTGASGAPADQPPQGWIPLWRRTATVRQLQLTEIDGAADPLDILPIAIPDPLQGGTDPAFVQFKEIELDLDNLAFDLDSGQVSPIAGSSGQRVRILKAY